MALSDSALCGVNQVKDGLGDQGADENVIEDAINAFSVAIQLYVRRKFKPKDTVVRTLKFPYDGDGWLNLSAADLEDPTEIQAGTVTAIVFHSDLPAAQQLTLSPGDSTNEADYRLYPLNQTPEGTHTALVLPLARPLRWTGSATPAPLPQKKVEVSITAKFGAGVVPDDVVKACIRECVNDYRNPEGYGSRNLGELGFSDVPEISTSSQLPPLSRGTRRLLWSYRSPTIA